MKKLFARIALVAFLSPVAAHAILPLIVGGLVMATNSTTLTTALIGSAAVVGAAIAFIGMAGGGASTPPADAPILVHLNPLEPLPIPAGWTPPAGAAIEPVAPTTSTTGTGNASPGAGVTVNTPGSIPAACSMVPGELNLVNGIYYGRASGGVYPAPLTAGGVYNSSCGVGTNAAQVSACQTGYYWSGGTGCTKNNESQVKKPADSKCTIIRTGNTFALDARDSDCVGLPAGVTVGSTSVTAKPSLAETQKVQINGDGSITTTTTVINTTNNTTTTTTVNASGSGVGGTKITGIGVTTVNGTGDQAAPPTTFPTDLNKESTQSAVKAAVEALKDKQCGGVGQVKCDVKMDETGTATDGSLSTQKGAYDTATAARKTDLESIGSAPRTTGVVGLSIAWPSGACSDPSVSIKGRTLSMPLCANIGPFNLLMTWLMGILTAITMFGIATSAVKT